MSIEQKLAVEYITGEITGYEVFNILKEMKNPELAQKHFWDFVKKYSGYSYPQKGEE